MTTRNAEAVSRALRNIREFGESHREPVPSAARPEAALPQEPASQEAPGEAAGSSVGLDHAE
jgi:hypothetical protein